MSPLLLLVGASVATLLLVRSDAARGLRQRVLDAAEGELGDGRIDVYWESCKVGQFHPQHWCGCFALWALHEAGLALDTKWIVGKGFASKLPITDKPQPGDIAYFDQPWQHHALVVSFDGTTLVTLDGNAPGVRRVVRTNPKGVVFYSIEPFIEAAT